MIDPAGRRAAHDGWSDRRAAPVAGCCMLYRLGRRGAARRARPDRRSRGTAPAPRSSRSLGQRKLLAVDRARAWRTSPCSGASCVLVLTIVEGYGALFDARLPDPGHRQLRLARLRRGPLRRARAWSPSSRSRSIRLRAVAQRARAAGPGSSARTSDAAWFVLFMIFNVVWTPAALPRRPDQRAGREHDRLPAVPARRVRLRSGSPRCWSRWARRQRGHRDGRPAARAGVILGFIVFVIYSKHLHIVLVAAQRRPGPPAARPRGPAADVLRRQAGRLRGPGRGRPDGRRARSRTSPGRACSTSPPAPSAAAASRSARRGTPTSRCRPSCSSWPCATTPWPRRPYLLGRPASDARADARCPTSATRARGRAARSSATADRTGRRHRPRRAVVVHHVRRLRGAVPRRHRARRPHRRHAPLPGAHGVGVPRGGRHHAAQPRARGRPVGPRARRSAWSGPSRSTSRCASSAPTARTTSPTTSSTCSGSAAPARSTTAPRGPPEPWRPAARGRGRVHGARRGRDLHRRPRPPDGARVPLPDARPAERRDAQRGRRPANRRHLRALLQHPGQRVPAARRPLRGRPPHPAARPARGRRAGSRRWPRSTSR